MVRSLRSSPSSASPICIADLPVHTALPATGLFVRVDRTTPWGNPFELGKDGDRATVIAAYRDHYPPSKPSLLGRLGELRGKALGCWCAPLPCHADVLVTGTRRLRDP